MDKNYSAVTINVLEFTHNRSVISHNSIRGRGGEPEYQVRFPDLQISLWMPVSELADTIFNSFV